MEFQQVSNHRNVWLEETSTYRPIQVLATYSPGAGSDLQSEGFVGIWWQVDFTCARWHLGLSAMLSLSWVHLSWQRSSSSGGLWSKVGHSGHRWKTLPNPGLVRCLALRQDYTCLDQSGRFLSNPLLNISGKGDSTTPLVSLLQCLTTFTVRVQVTLPLRHDYFISWPPVCWQLLQTCWCTQKF